MQSLCTLRNRCRQWSRNTRYQADATPYLGRTFTGWFAPACGWRTYSITSSARASADAGRSRPSALAVFRLTTSSYLVGVCTGRSAGFAPALISAIMGHSGAAPTSASSSSKARTKLPGGPRRGLRLSQIGRQMPALLSFTFGVSEVTIAALTRQIFAVRQQLMSEFPQAAKTGSEMRVSSFTCGPARLKIGSRRRTH